MSYTPHTEQDVKEMLSEIGLRSVEDLFAVIHPDLRAKSFHVPEGKSEFEVMEHLRRLAAKNSADLINFVGVGFYDHYIPAAVDSIAALPEFSTAYTPYQPEASQGWLQALYEYQSAICLLTDMEVSNASLYDGGTALHEACMMAVRSTGRTRILVDASVNAIYRKMVQTYTSNLSLEFVEIPFDEHCGTSRAEVQNLLDGQTAAILLQNPNFFGRVDDYSDIAEAARRAGALVVESVYPVSLGLLKTPGQTGADIAVGEGQSLGIPLSFGGPYLGFMATRKELVRRMPGRIIGRTVDRDGTDCFVMTMQAREQHIRREKATSNICSNEALCALRALAYLCLLGPQGLRELARLILDKAEFTKDLLGRIPGVSIDRSIATFNEFVVHLPRSADDVVKAMIDKGFVPGFPLGRYYPGMERDLLVAVTEKRTKEEIVKMAESLEAVLCD